MPAPARTSTLRRIATVALSPVATLPVDVLALPLLLLLPGFTTDVGLSGVAGVEDVGRSENTGGARVEIFFLSSQETS